MSWAERALTDVLDRVAATEPELGGRWPLYADPASGRWTTTARGSWTGGFWAGLLWLRAAVTDDPADRSAALARTELLAPWLEADTATRGLIFWYGTALGDGPATTLRTEAAKACLAAHDPALGVVPWGGAFGGPRELVRVDGLPGLVPLLRQAGPDGIRAAEANVERYRELAMTTSPPHPAWRALPGGTWTPHPEPPAGWSRTVGWLCLATEDPRWLDQAAVAARFDPGAPAVPPADARRRDGPPDTSAAAIEAVAALKLAHRTGGGAARVLRERGTAVLRALADGHLREGRLLDGCYDLGHGVATRHELVWGDFFLAVGLATLTGVLGPSDC
ncbi:hypothetical protein [Spirillospora sp. CA-294931]|uniref:hypothetical protein n=1 Tax=Spirillospora sp. CA-294931 TaxID=3240042 RepID=UPI003D8ED9B8